MSINGHIIINIIQEPMFLLGSVKENFMPHVSALNVLILVTADLMSLEGKMQDMVIDQNL